MKKFNGAITRANRRISIGSAAGLLAGSYFISGFLGLVRDRLLAAQFGISGTLDAYFAAFSIPDLVFYLLVTGALAVTFIPVLTDRLVNHNKRSAWELSSSVLNTLAIVTFISSIVIFIFADPLMWMVAPKFDIARHEVAVNLTRILAINPFLFSISSVFASIQQAFGRFFFYALAPVIYNVGIIVGIMALSPRFGIYGVALGAVSGAAAQMLIQQLGLIGLGYKYQAKIFWKNKGFKRVLRLMLPRSVDEAVEHLSAIIERAIASGLAVGSIAAYQYAFNLKNLPITLFGATIATAIFPRLSEQAASSHTGALKRQVAQITRVMLWLIVPTAGLYIILRGYIVRLLFGFGDPTTAAILGWFAGAIIFQSLVRLIARVFYAYQDTRTPLYSSMAALALNIVLALTLVSFHGVKGLAMAQSLVAGFEAVLLYAMIKRKIGNVISSASMIALGKIVFASSLTTFTAYLLIRYAFPLVKDQTGFLVLAPKFTAISVLSISVYLAVGWWIRQPEAETVVKKIGNFIFKRQPIS